MNLTLEHHGRHYQTLATRARSLAIELDFDTPQPNCFQAPPATRTTMKSGAFVGRTEEGGSCNVDAIELIPHCNGTHTETIGHIVSEKEFIGRAVLEPLMLAALISVKPLAAAATEETYLPDLISTDRVITATQIEKAIATWMQHRPSALIIRTFPNQQGKQSRTYMPVAPPPFFSHEAITTINRLGVQHLLTDLPSIDRLLDNGKLTNHRLFWNVPDGSHQLMKNSFRDKTITELIYVDDEIVDGMYLLNLQIPAFRSDAAPSRPLIWPVEVLKSEI